MIEVLIVAVLVAWSALVVFKKVFPRTAYTTFAKLAQLCQARGWHAMAKRLSPAMVSGCGGSCGCSSNDKSNVAQPVEVQAVKWK
ncbi:DUF6587 family protein [Acinetobacter sp. MD2]|uniref:DUF6587 family protein n=1 Tax=Acinetobacter sp. MD2 TaxID=2600066 RepID=UPI002D1E9B61|nr:DUF6587 family protein [Acinetobacter sp. MD2]MEB3766792.1 hypothetical protein [Acinetobacter sp. MD2]